MKMRNNRLVRKLMNRFIDKNTIRIYGRTFSSLEVAELINVYNSAVELSQYCQNKSEVVISDLETHGLGFFKSRKVIDLG